MIANVRPKRDLDMKNFYGCVDFKLEDWTEAIPYRDTACPNLSSIVLLF
jgi:hypothetical protein